MIFAVKKICYKIEAEVPAKVNSWVYEGEKWPQLNFVTICERA